MTEQTPELASPDALTVDQKLDKIMEAVAFQSQVLVSALVAFDKKLQESSSFAKKESKIIKPVM